LKNPQRYFQRFYDNLPMPHTRIHFSFLVRPIDTWENNDRFAIQFDNLPILQGITFDTVANYSGESVCGNPNGIDFPPFRVIVDLPHNTSNITVTVFSDLNNQAHDESFGFRDIDMLFFNVASDIIDPINQTLCAIANVTLPDKWCPCLASNYYMEPVMSGNCYPCDNDCRSCSGPLINQCLSCYPGKYRHAPTSTCQFCDISCVTCSAAGPNACTACIRGYFLTSQNNCVGSCPLPLVQSPLSNTDRCYSPCPSNYVYWNGTCINNCDYPLVPLLVHHYQTCTFPCEIHEYLYWNGTCSMECPAPLTKRITTDRLFCDYKCNVTDYLFWDSSCGGSCSFPLLPHTEGTPPRNYCGYPCTNASDYLYWNGSCMATCESPLTRRTTRSALFCDFPCSGLTPIVNWDKSCSSSCNYPLIQVDEGSPIRNFCIFPCQTFEYIYWNGTCSDTCAVPLTYTIFKGRYFCHFQCSIVQYLQYDGQCVSTCNFPLVPRLEAGNNYCDYPCLNQRFLYWNGSCLDSCNFPFKITENGPAKFCNYPCNPMSEYLYWNGTCGSECNFPLIPREEGNPTRQFCSYSCQQGEYLYPNGSCLTSCEMPLRSREESKMKYCDYPCDFSTGPKYLYWNSSCLGSCGAPLQIRIENSFIFCEFTCDSNEYLNWDGTCSSTCQTPLTSYTEGTGYYLRKFCNHTCYPEYLYWNGQCYNNCSFPLKTQVKTSSTKTSLFCLPPCEDISEFYFPDTKTCHENCPSPSYMNDSQSIYPNCLKVIEEDEGWFIRHILTTPQESGTVSPVMLVKMMQYVRYIDIPLSPRMQKLAMSKNRNLIFYIFGWPMSEEMEVTFQNQSLPETFQKHGFSSHFLVNFWEDFTTVFIVISVAILFTILENIFKILSWDFLGDFFERLRSLTRWNFALILFALIIDDLILYSAFQFQTIGGDHRDATLFTAFSFIGSVLGIILSVAFFAGIAILVNHAQIICQTWNEENENEEPSQDFIKFYIKWQDFQVLFRGFNTDTIMSHSFYLIYVLRVCCIPMLIATCFYHFPFAQSIMQASLSLLTIAYILLTNPLKNKLSRAQLMINECIILMMNLCMVALASLHQAEVKLSDTSVVLLGDIVIFGNFSINVNTLLFLFIKVMTEASVIHRSIKMQYIKDRTTWLQLIAIVFQQIGMGFEEISARDLCHLDPTDNTFHIKPQEKYDDEEVRFDSEKTLNNEYPQTRENVGESVTYEENYPNYSVDTHKKIKPSMRSPRQDLTIYSNYNPNLDNSVRNSIENDVFSSKKHLMSNKSQGNIFNIDESNNWERNQDMHLHPNLKESELPGSSFNMPIRE